MKTENLNTLRQYLGEMRAGTVAEVDPVEELLAQAWDEFEGSDAGGMEAYKLLDRTEDMNWNPPNLSFNLERHGAAALGSTRAEIQSWLVNTVLGTASIVGSKLRQIHPRSPKWDAKTVGREIAQLIIAEQDDPRLIWNRHDHVRIRIGKIVPDSYKQTREARSRRLWAALMAELVPRGWVRVSRHLEKVR